MTDQLSTGVGKRRILLLDCDAFFVQVARFVDPEGAGRAQLLLVGGSASGRGVVTSASYDARRYGVHSAMPMSEAVRLCPDAMVVPVPRSACVERSRAVREVLADLAPVVQAASIDEFYLDMTGTERLLRGESFEATATRIRKTVLEATDISVSIGGGTGKLVAKLAAGRAKPAGVHIVPAGREQQFLASFELSEIPGVGPALLKQLHDRGLQCVEDLARVEESWLRRWFGEARGRWLWERSRGVDPAPVVAAENRKSISSERTFDQDIVDPELLERHLLQLVVSVGESLRSKALTARTVTVKVRDSDFQTRQASRTLTEPLESDRPLHELAVQLLHELRSDRRTPTRLIGVGVSNLREAGEARQLSLLEEDPARESDRDRTLSHLGDELRARYGREALLPGRIVREPREEEEPDER